METKDSGGAPFPANRAERRRKEKKRCVRKMENRRVNRRKKH